MSLDLGSLTRAVAALQRALEVWRSLLAAESLDSALMETVRAGVVQDFEVAYEQCWRFVQRWIRENRSAEEASVLLTRRELFRAAARYGLIEDPARWFAHGDARNLTAHTYNEATAQAIVAAAVPFLDDARFLLAQLEQRND